MFHSQITIRFQIEMQPSVSKYLHACFNACFQDRNNIVRKYYASALGHLIGIAKEQSIIRLFARLSDFYYENRSNQGISQTLVAINKRNQEVLKDYSAQILPLIFFAMHEPTNDENSSSVEAWKELWNDVSVGDAGIRLNIDQIVQMLEKSLADSSWSTKSQAANAINTIATRLGKTLGNAERNILVIAILQNMVGRTYEVHTTKK